MKSNKGITLIELLLVVAVVAILAAIAIPTYDGYMQRARRVDAKTGLEQLRAAQEMFRAERGRYANNGDDGNALLVIQNSWGVPANPIGDYNLVLNSTTANSYLAEAQPWNPRQTSDGSLFINHNGVKTPADKWAK